MMMDRIAEHIKQSLIIKEDDFIMVNNVSYKINKENYSKIESKFGKTIAYIDGGQAEIINGGNFCLSFIRVVAVVFDYNVKREIRDEFYIFATKNTATIFPLGDRIIADFTVEEELTNIPNIARRCAELAMANKLEADYKLLDGTLELRHDEEKKHYSEGLSALAKSSSLFTASGNSPIVILNKLGPEGTWKYKLNTNTSFVKLHPNAKHLFRFEGKDCTSYLIENSKDALFLGYPYGLILADKLARISNEEKKSLQMKFLLNNKNKEIMQYLSAQNAHEILDSLG